MNTEHTHGPWSADPDDPIHTATCIRAPDNTMIAQTHSYKRGSKGMPDRATRIANAAFIVRACNAYDDMLSALKGILDRDDLDCPDDLRPEWKAVVAAIAKAEGRTE